MQITCQSWLINIISSHINQVVILVLSLFSRWSVPITRMGLSAKRSEQTQLRQYKTVITTMILCQCVPNANRRCTCFRFTTCFNSCLGVLANCQMIPLCHKPCNLNMSIADVVQDVGCKSDKWMDGYWWDGLGWHEIVNSYLGLF